MDTRKAVKTYHRNLAIVLAIIVAIFAAIPLLVDKPYIINIFVLTFYMSTLSMAWNILGGITGQNSLGLAAYMGLGAYVCCLVVTKTGMNPWVAAVLDMLVVGVVAGVIFFPSLILRGPYFTLVSIAFAESIRQFIITRSSSAAHPAWPALRQGLLCAVPLYQQGAVLLHRLHHDGGRLHHHEEDRPLQAGLCAAHHPRG